MFGFGIWELLIILAIIVALFGAKRLLMFREGLGGLITNFKTATKKNIEDQARIEEYTTVIKEDTTANKEDATVIKEENS